MQIISRPACISASLLLSCSIAGCQEHGSSLDLLLVLALLCSWIFIFFKNYPKSYPDQNAASFTLREDDQLRAILLDPEQQHGLIGRLIQHHYQLLKPQGICLFIYHPERDGYYIDCHLSLESIDDDRCYGKSEGILGVTRLLKEAYTTTKDGNPGHILDYYRNKVTILSQIAVPICLEQRQAALLLDSDTIDFFDANRTSIAKSCAEMIESILQSGKRIEDELVAAARNKNFFQLYTALHESLNPDDIITKTFDYLKSLIRFDLIGIVKHNPKEKTYDILRLNPLDLPLPQEPIKEEITSLVSCALKAKSVLSYDDLAGYSKIPILFNDKYNPDTINDIKSLYIIPVLVRSEVYGAVIIGGKEKQLLDRPTIDHLSGLCEIAGVYLQLADLYCELKETSITDGLTGLKNHRFFQEHLSKELQRADRYQEQLALVLIDIDHFKKINDTYGHPVGDTVLAEIAVILTNSIRKVDSVARYGGEEFSIVLVNTDANKTVDVVERLRQSILDAEIATSQGPLKITISMGVAIFPRDAKSKEKLIEYSDAALYHAKEHGRNRFTFYHQL